MAITITANLDASGVKTGADQVTKSLDGMSSTAERSGDSLQDFARETQNEINDLKSRAAALKSELASMGDVGGDAMEEISDGANQATVSIDKMADRRDRIQTVAVAYLAVADAIKKSYELGKKVVEVVNALAEEGNPAAIELADSFKEVKQSLLDIAEDPEFQSMMRDVVEIIHEEVIPAIKSIPDAWVESQDALERLIASLGETLGVFAEGTSNTLAEMQASDAKIRELEKRRLEAARLQRQEAKKLKEETEEADRRNEKLQTELRKAAEKSTAEIRKLRELKERESAKELEDIQKLNQAKLDAERKLIEDRKRLISGANTGGAKSIVDNVDRDKLREQYANSQLAADGVNTFGKNMSDEMLARRRRSILNRAREQFDAGQVNPAELAKAQQELANAAVNAGENSGKVSKETAQALREGIKELANQSNELNSVRAELEIIKQITGAVTKQGERRRAQVQGAGR